MRKLITVLMAAALLTGAWVVMDAQTSAPIPSGFQVLASRDAPDPEDLSGQDSIGNAVNRKDRKIYVYQGFGERSYSNLFNPGHRCSILLHAESEGGTNVGLGVVLRYGWAQPNTSNAALADTTLIRSFLALADTLWISAAGTYYKSFTATWAPLAYLEFIPNYVQSGDTTLNGNETYVRGIYIWDRY